MLISYSTATVTASRAKRDFAQVNRELPMDMEREDSNPSIEALIEAHEDAIADNAVTTDGENDETPRPSAIVPKHASHAPHPDLTVAIGSSDALSRTNSNASAIATNQNNANAAAHVTLPLDDLHARTSATGTMAHPQAPEASPSRATAAILSRSPSAKASLHSMPLSKSRSFSTYTLAAQAGGSLAMPQSQASSSSSHHHVHSLNKFVLYETKRRFYIVGTNTSESIHRVLKIDRTSPQEELNIVEDKTVYSEKQLKQLLRMLDDGNRHTGGFTRAGVFFGIAGTAGSALVVWRGFFPLRVSPNDAIYNDRLREIHCRLVPRRRLQTNSRRSPWGTLYLPLRGHANVSNII